MARSLPVIPEPPATQIELLTEQFYRWERRGRGWQVWPYRIRLEPPFTPFRFHWVPSATEQVDDGRRPTLLSAAVDRLIGLLRRAPRAPGVPEIDSEEVGGEPAEASDELAELAVTLRSAVDVPADWAEHLLISLPRFSRPLGFEVIGTSEAVSVQFLCPRWDRAAVEQHLRACFPEGVITHASGRLGRIWSSGAPHPLVVEYGLAEEFMLPLRSYPRFTVDPLAGVAAALSELAETEVGVLQVLWEPVRNGWAESVLRAVLDDTGSPFFLDAPDLTRLARDKVSRPLFASLVRVGARAQSPERAEHIVRGVGASLSALANPPSNWLVPLKNDGYEDGSHEGDLLDRTTHRSGMILSAPELVSLVHPPSASVHVEKLVRESRRTRAAPPGRAPGAYTLGVNDHGGRPTEVGLTPEQRSQHVYLVGASGMGKSTLLLNLVLQDIEAGEGLALLDPHGDLVDEVLRRCPEKDIEDLVLLDPSDAEYPIGFNVLSAHSELERTLLSSDLVAVFRRLSTSWGDQMTSVLGNAIQAFLESERGGTLLDLRRFLIEAEFRKEFLRGVRDPEVVYYWQREFPLLSGKPQAPLLTRLDTFLRPKTIRFMVAQKESRLDLRQVMDQGRVLLARLSQGAIGEENSTLLGTLLVAKLHQIAMSRQELSEAERRPFYLYIDEFHNFVTPSMEKILSGARKYRLGLVLAHQELQQVRSRSPDVLNSVLTNPYARICFRVGDQDARTLAEGFGHFDARELQSLGKGEALVRLERAEYDFNLRTALPPRPEAEMGRRVRERIIACSRAEYGRPRSEVEALLGPTQPDAPAVGSPASLTVRRHPPADEALTPSDARRPPIQPEPPDAAPPSAGKPLAGRGGAQHRYLQELIRQWAESNGWRADLEEPVLGNLGRVDVALRKGSRSIACEVAVTTSAAHEIENVRKCFAAGFDYVLAVSPTRRLLAQLRKEAPKALAERERARVQFSLPEEMFGVLDALNSRGQTTEQTVRGYRVKVRVAQDPVRSPDGARSTIASVVAKALQRLKGKG